MGRALYRSYRSKKLSEIVGQEHITTALANALKHGRICHAYLFTGPRGVGKTSTARILAHEINQLPYDGERLHLDIIEIDAASNRRIDEIRDLRDKVHIAPTSAKYKVYIIDEVHMLTREAFNALLKTLEEPPAHVVFILATTEIHKLPETIISRTQRYAFKPIEQPKVVAHLRHIAQQEKISITDDALELIAAHGEGSFRDSISLLDQVRNMSGEITLADVQAVLGIAPADLIDNLIAGLHAHDAMAVAEGLRRMHDQGYEPSHVAKQLGASLRNALVANTCQLPKDTALKLLASLVQVPASPDPRIALEIALLDAALDGVPGRTAAPAQTQSSASKAPASKAQPPKSAPSPKTMPEESAAAPAIQINPKLDPIPSPDEPELEQSKSEPTGPAAAEPETPSEGESATATQEGEGVVLDDVAWSKVLLAIKQKHNTLYSIARSAQPHFEPGRIVLELSFPFHQKRLSETRNKQKLCDTVREVTGYDVQINCIVGQGKPLQPSPPPALPPADGEVVHTVESTSSSPSSSAIDTISNIFGGAEVLES